MTFAGEPVRIVNRKLLCMLAYLAMIDGRRESRERLVGLLWSESDEKLARGSLRQVMTAFRRISAELGFDGFDTDRLHVALSPGRIAVDLEEIERRATADDLHPLLLDVDDLPSRVLQGCEDIDPAFGAWLPVQREALRDRLLRALSAEMERLGLDAPGSENVAKAVLRLDPTHEEAARRLMEARALAGDMGGAVKVYNALWKVLEDDYDMEPSAQTAELIADIKSGGFEERQPPRPAPGARRPRPERCPRPPAAPARGGRPPPAARAAG
ncbi:MAG: BTAD domain-containing putative transcriptional regulator, partial [Pseudomonadota bacterium]